MGETNKQESVSKTAILPNWLPILLAISVAIWVGFLYWDTAGLSAVWIATRGLFIGIGVAGVAACVPELINVLCRNIWPRPELRYVCADVWNDQRTQQIELALRSPIPSATLRAVYKGDVYLEEFDSSVIYHSISEMHDGAFLAAVDLWDPENYNEDLLVTNEAKCTSGLQFKILDYRNQVARRITDSHIIAARRYRVKASSNLDFVTKGNTPEKKCLRLRSLALLADNVAFDLQKGWIVDVEYCADANRHYPNLDYALLFGAQPPNGMGGTARVAYITDSRAALAEKEDYIGVQVNDPLIITRLMKDRFWAFVGIKRADEFLENAVTLITSHYNSLSTDVGECSAASKEALAHVSGFLSNNLNKGASPAIPNSSQPIAAEFIEIGQVPEAGTVKPAL